MIGERKMRAEFEAFVLSWTGKTMEQHEQARTTGLEFAWHCWVQASAKAGISELNISHSLIAEVEK